MYIMKTMSKCFKMLELSEIFYTWEASKEKEKLGTKIMSFNKKRKENRSRKYG